MKNIKLVTEMIKKQLTEQGKTTNEDINQTKEKKLNYKLKNALLTMLELTHQKLEIANNKGDEWEINLYNDALKTIQQQLKGL